MRVPLPAAKIRLAIFIVISYLLSLISRP